MKSLHAMTLLALTFVMPGTVLGNTRTLELPSPPNAGSIGTQVDGINTAVHSITISTHDLVHRYGLLYIEVRGEIAGVGWGGVDRANAFKQTHYEYRYPYVLRIPFGWDGTLVVHRHGTGPIALWEGLEASLGERNFARQFHETADRVVSDAALHRKFGRQLQDRTKLAFGFDVLELPPVNSPPEGAQNDEHQGHRERNEKKKDVHGFNISLVSGSMAWAKTSSAR